mmetsp:Transcript_102522/g.198575  ORF Transcript_102522/g.198575 Transcript_102522/m.198575 type:complete len:1077 (+) Transcript_102522:50-3280(+)
MSGTELASGCLHKLGPMRKWRRRWCVLQPTGLVEYSDDTCQEQLCQIKFERGACGFRFSTAGAPGEATMLRKERPYGFVLDFDPSMGKGRPFSYMDAGGVGALERWMVALGQASAAVGALPKRPPRDAVELQRPLPLHFEAPSILRQGENGYADSLIYKVEHRTATLGWGLYHAFMCTSPAALEGLTGGVCRQMVQRLEPGFEVNLIEWWPWKKREPARRFQIQLYGVSWTLAMQLGSLDGLLPSSGTDLDLEAGRLGIALQYNPAEIVGTVGRKQANRWERPSQEEVTTLVLQRAKTLGLPVMSLESQPCGGFKVKLSEELPELIDREEAFQKIVEGNGNLSPQEQEVRQYLEKLQAEFPDFQKDTCEEDGEGNKIHAPFLYPKPREAVISLARSMHTQIWRKEQAAKMPRKGCLDDVPYKPCDIDYDRRQKAEIQRLKHLIWLESVDPHEVRCITSTEVEDASDMIMPPNLLPDIDDSDDWWDQPADLETDDECVKFYREFASGNWINCQPGFVVKEVTRINLLKSCKWTVDMPLPLWQFDFMATQPSWKKVDPESLHQVEECKMVFESLPGGLFSRCTKIFPKAKPKGQQAAGLSKGDYAASRAVGGASGKVKLFGKIVVAMLRSPKNRLRVQSSMRKPLSTELVGPAWRELPLDVIKNDTPPTEESVSKRKKLLKKTWLPTSGKFRPYDHLKKLILSTLDTEQLPAWTLEKLIPEDYTRELALVNRRSRVEEFLAAKAQKEVTRVTKGKEFVFWPINRKWDASWCKQPKLTPTFLDDALKTFKACNPGFTQEPIELPPLATISGSGPRTVCLWVKTWAATGEQVLYACGTGKQGSSFEIVLYNGKPKLARWSNQKIQDDPRVPQIADGEWHHVAVTHNGQEAFLWVDGNLWFTEKSKLSTPSTACRLGQKVGYKKATFIGHIRGIWIFNSDIQKEVKNVYNCQVYFRMEDVARKKRFLCKPHLYVDNLYLEELTAFRKEWRQNNLSAHDVQNWEVLAPSVTVTRYPWSSNPVMWLEKGNMFQAKLLDARDQGSTLEIDWVWRWDSFAGQWNSQHVGQLYTKLNYPKIRRRKT